MLGGLPPAVPHSDEWVGTWPFYDLDSAPTLDGTPSSYAFSEVPGPKARWTEAAVKGL